MDMNYEFENQMSNMFSMKDFTEMDESQFDYVEDFDYSKDYDSAEWDEDLFR